MYCRQKAGWIKMPLGTEVGLVPGHIVLDGEYHWTQLSPPMKRGTAAPYFRPMSIVDLWVVKRSLNSATAELL